MYIQVYFHKSVRILSIHLVEFIKKLLKSEDLNDISRFLKINDTYIISKIFEKKEFKEDFLRIFGRQHFKNLLSTENYEVYKETKEKLLGNFPKELLRFDEVRKVLYSGNIYIKTEKGLKRAHELSPLIASLKPIKLYRIYVDRGIWKEAVSLLEH